MKRRDFLKGLTYAASFCLLGPSIKLAEGKTIAPSLKFDAQKCIGCLACVTACRRPHEPKEVFRLKLKTEQTHPFPHIKIKFDLAYCRQCEKAPCVSACPEGALIKTKEGVIVLDRGKCKGHGLCVKTCPYEAVEVLYNRAFKCDLCYTELKEGYLPRCVAVCPTEALYFEPSKYFVPQKPPAPGERLVYTVCLACNSRCGLRVRTNGKQILRVDGNPYHPYNRSGKAIPYKTPLLESLKVCGATCAKPQMDEDYLKNPYRILKPLKRYGPRGSGKFEPISWRQLIKEISEGGKLFAHLGDERHYPGLKEFLKDTPIDPEAPELGPVRNRVVWLTGRSQGGRKHFIKRFICQAVGSINHIPHTDICGIGFRMGNFILTDGQAVEFKADPDAAEYILVFGSNFFSALQPGPSAYAARLIRRVREGKARYVVIDPRGHEAIAHAYRWLPVKPGQDGALALGLISVLLEQGLFDREFLSFPNLKAAQKAGRNVFTNATHLVVETEEGERLLEAHEVGFKGRGPIVVTKEGTLLPAAKAQEALLEWEGEINSLKLKTAFSLFKERVLALGLDYYAQEAGISKETIQEVAREFAACGEKACAFAYHGAGNYVGGAYASFAIALLNVLVGNINRRGGYLRNGPGLPWQQGLFDLKNFSGARRPQGVPISREKASYEKTSEFRLHGYPAKLPWFPFTKGGLTVSALAGIDQRYPYPVGILFTYFFNPLYSIPGGKRFRATLRDQKKVPLHVSIDVTINESNLYADYIVPDVTYLEGHYGFLSPHAPAEHFLAVRTPVFEPLTGRTPDGRPYCLETFLIDLAEACGLPGFGEKAILDTQGQLHALKRAEDFYLRGVANLAYLSNVPEAPKEEQLWVERNYPVARWRQILPPKIWAQVATVLARGGVFFPSQEAFDEDGNLKNGVSQVFLFNNTLAHTKNALNGKNFSGLVIHQRAQEARGDFIFEKDRDFPFILLSHKHKLHTQSRTICYEKALYLLPEPCLSIHEIDARKLGLKDDEMVLIFSRHQPKPLRVRIKITQGIRPGCVAISHHYGHTQHGAQSLTVKRAEEVFLGGAKVVSGDKLIPDLRRAAGLGVNRLSRLDESLFHLPLIDLLGGIPDFSNTKVKIQKFS